MKLKAELRGRFRIQNPNSVFRSPPVFCVPLRLRGPRDQTERVSGSQADSSRALAKLPKRRMCKPWCRVLLQPPSHSRQPQHKKPTTGTPSPKPIGPPNLNTSNSQQNPEPKSHSPKKKKPQHTQHIHRKSLQGRTSSNRFCFGRPKLSASTALLPAASLHNLLPLLLSKHEHEVLQTWRARAAGRPRCEPLQASRLLRQLL